MIAGGVFAASLAIAAPDVPVVRAIASPQTGRGAPEQPDLMRLWAAVGKCVVQRDRAASVAFVRATLGTEEAASAQRRLDPVFAGCLAGSRVPGPSSVVLRRAAVAAALGVASRT